jgi:glutaredoxin-like YruB-family protein
MSEEKEVVLYSTPTCPYCKMAKDYLTGKNVKFKEIDVSADQKAAKEMIERSGQMGVPQIVVGDTIIVGYDSGEIDKALK